MAMAAQDERKEFMRGLDLHQPQWAINFAEQSDLIDYARGNASMDHIRDRVASRLMVPVRAAIEAGIVSLK